MYFNNEESIKWRKNAIKKYFNNETIKSADWFYLFQHDIDFTFILTLMQF